MPRGGQRPGAGRPGTSRTYRTPITWRLPADLLVRIGNYARVANVSVTAWVEAALYEAVERVRSQHMSDQTEDRDPGDR